MSTQGYCWEPVVIAIPGKDAIASRNIDVLAKPLSRVKFTTSWSVLLDGSASYTTSLCKYSISHLHVDLLVQPSSRTLGITLHAFYRCSNISLVRIVIMRGKSSKRNSCKYAFIGNVPILLIYDYAFM